MERIESYIGSDPALLFNQGLPPEGVNILKTNIQENTFLLRDGLSATSFSLGGPVSLCLPGARWPEPAS